MANVQVIKFETMSFGEIQKLILVYFERQQLRQPVCPKCRRNIIGRATDMENFLKVNFIKIESSRAKKIFKSQKNIRGFVNF